jgi:hypothetical protein
MTSTLARRTVVVATLAATAFSGVAVAGAAVSAGAAAKSHTSLSIRVAHGSINPGGSDVVTGTLSSADRHVSGRRIVLLAKPAGTTTFTKDKAHRTSANGRIGFEVTPAVTTRYELAFRGNKLQQPSHSGVVTVRVRNTTSLTIALTSGSIAPGASDTVSGVLSLDGSPLVGDTVTLLGHRAKQSATKVGSAITAADGSVSFVVTPPATTQYVLVFRKTTANAGARSAVVTVHVQLVSSISIRAKANPRNGKEIISGNLRGQGTALPHRLVSLQARPDGSSTWTTVASGRTSHNGGVSFTQPAPTTTEDYQLVFAGGPLYLGCQSGVVTVPVS